jgi:hypothetical protein
MDLLETTQGTSHLDLALVGSYAAVAFGLALGVQWLVSRLWRAGLDAPRQLGSVVVLLKLVLSLGFAALLAATAVSEFGRGRVYQPVVLLLVFVLAVVSVGRDVVGCAVLVFSAKVRVGDRLQVGELSGTVRVIGILQTHLRDAFGTKLVVPNREFLVRSLEIAKTKHSVPLEFKLVAPERGIPPSSLQRIRAVLLLCPYRSAHSTVHAEVRAGELELQLEVWSPEALVPAEQQIGVAVQRLFTEGPE